MFRVFAKRVARCALNRLLKQPAMSASIHWDGSARRMFPMYTTASSGSTHRRRTNVAARSIQCKA